MIEIYVGFCPLHWLCVSCEVADDTCSRVRLAGTNSPVEFFVWVDTQPALGVGRLQGFSSGERNPKIGFIVQPNHHLGASECRGLLFSTCWHLCKYLVSACVGAKPPYAHYSL